MPLLYVNNVALFNNQPSKLAFFVKVAYLKAKTVALMAWLGDFRR